MPADSTSQIRGAIPSSRAVWKVKPRMDANAHEWMLDRVSAVLPVGMRI